MSPSHSTSVTRTPGDSTRERFATNVPDEPHANKAASSRTAAHAISQPPTLRRTPNAYNDSARGVTRRKPASAQALHFGLLGLLEALEHLLRLVVVDDLLRSHEEFLLFELHVLFDAGHQLFEKI